MANRFSIQHNYAPFISPYNVEAISNVLMYKQQKYDLNAAATQDLVDTITNTDLVRPQDREYLKERLNNVVNDVNKYYNADLSDSNVARSIQSHISEAIDDRVINAISGTQQYRQFTEEMDKLKLNKPELYSPVNEAHALRPFIQWQNEEAGTPLGELRYTPYVNVEEKLNKLMSDYRKNNKGRTIQIPDGNGYLREEVFDRLTEPEVRQLALSSLSETDRSQLAIDGWWMAQSNPEMFSNVTTTDFINNQLGRYDKEIGAANALLNGAENDPAKKAELENRIAFLKNEKENLNLRARDILGNEETFNPIAAGYFLATERLADGVAQRWSYDNSSLKYSNDRSYWERLDYERKVRRDMQDFQIAKQKLAIKLASSAGAGQAGSGGPDSIGTVTQGENKYEAVNVKNKMINDLNTATSNLKVGAQQLMESLNENDRRSLNALIDVTMSKNDPEYEGLSREEVTYKVLSSVTGGFKNRAIINNSKAMAAYAAMDDANRQMEQVNKAMFKGAEDRVARLSANQAEIENIVLSNPNMAVYDNEGNAYSAAYVLDNNIEVDGMAPRQAINATLLGEALVRKMFDDVTMNKYYGSDSRLFGGEASYYSDFNPSLKVRSNVTDFTPDLVALGNVLGENLSWSDILTTDQDGNVELKAPAQGEKRGLALIRSIVGDMDLSKLKDRFGLSQYLVDAKNKGRSIDFFNDVKYIDDRSIRNLLDVDSSGEWSENIDQNMADSYVGMLNAAKNVAFNVSEGGEEERIARKLGGIWISEALKNGILYENDKDVSISPSETFVLETQLVGDDKKYYIARSKNTKYKVEIDEQTLKANTIVPGGPTANYPVDGFNESLTDLSFPSDANMPYVRRVAKINPEVAVYSTAESTKLSLRQEFSTVFKQMTPDMRLVDNGLSKYFDTLVDNAGLFQINIVGEDDNITLELYDKNTYDPSSSNSPLVRTYLSGFNYMDSFIPTIRESPQFFYTMVLRSALKNYQKSNENLLPGDTPIVPRDMQTLINIANSLMPQQNGNEQQQQ